MNNIRLSTYRNKILKDYLAKSGFQVIELNSDLSKNGDIWRVQSLKPGYTILELNSSNTAYSERLVSDTIEKCNESERVICITNAVTDSLKNILLKNGITDLLTSASPGRIVSYLKLLDEPTEAESVKIVIIENNKTIIKILSRIINQFAFRPIFVDSIDELSKALKKKNPQFVLLSLEVDKILLNEFIKMSLSSTEIKSIPVISFKDMKKGLFIHEIVSGLNRITKVILSLEELLSYLIDLFYRKKVLTLMKNLSCFVDYNKNSIYSKKTLSQIYFSDGESFTDGKQILTSENYEKALAIIDLLKKSLLRVDGLRWLILDNCTSDISTCGEDGKI